jgi:uncharacterized protein (DUF433 family)
VGFVTAKASIGELFCADSPGISFLKRYVNFLLLTSGPALCYHQPEVNSMADEILVQRSQEILGGTPVFAGTRVPVQTLFAYIEEGDTLDEFLDDFPAVSRDHAVKVLERMKESFLARDYESAA